VDLFQALGANPALLALAVGLLGLAVGSFLNVVAMRLPRRMEQDWRAEAAEILQQPVPEDPRVSVLWPPSACPACGARIKPWHNVPLLGWLWLRGRCAACRAPISVQYPLVEAAAALLGMACVWRFGWSPQLLPVLVLTWTLLVLAVIDARTQLLPDQLTLPLLWLGLLVNAAELMVPLHDAVIGAAAGYLLLWAIFHGFRLLTGKEGMGYGDFKLLAAIGAWLGWQSLPLVVLFASGVGAIVGLALIALRRQQRDMPMAFGPFLAAAGVLALLFPDALTWLLSP
jgi:leader peptidase (prepilin peptidase) / N-methyltransferase